MNLGWTTKITLIRHRHTIKHTTILVAFVFLMLNPISSTSSVAEYRASIEIASVPSIPDREGLQYLYNDTFREWDNSELYRYDWEHDKHYINLTREFHVYQAQAAYIQLLFDGEWTEFLNMSPKWNYLWFREVEVYEPDGNEYPIMYNVKLVENETTTHLFTGNAIFVHDDDPNIPEVRDHGSTGDAIMTQTEEYSVWVNMTDDFADNSTANSDVAPGSENGSGIYSVEFSWYDGSRWTDWEYGSFKNVSYHEWEYGFTRNEVWSYTLPEAWKTVSKDYYMVFQVRITDGDYDRAGDNGTVILGAFVGGQVNVYPLPQSVITIVSMTGGVVIVLLLIGHWRKKSRLNDYEKRISAPSSLHFSRRDGGTSH